MKVLVTGGTGLLAPYLAEAMGDLGPVSTTGRSGGDFVADLTVPEQVRDLIDQAAPDIVIHAAAWTDVDGCEQDPVSAEKVNAGTAASFVSTLSDRIRLVIISTDQVYPDAPGPHREGTEDPVNAYGKSKLAGERAALCHPGALAVRTSFFGASRTPGRQSLSDFFAGKLASGLSFTAFDDIEFSPLHAKTLAKILRRMIELELTGVFNVGSRKGMSKASFASGIADHMGYSANRMHVGRSAAHPSRARRASDLRLDPRKIEAALGYGMPTLAHEIRKL